MKKYLIYTLIFAITLVFSNCEEQENVLFDNVNGQTLIDFAVSTANLQIVINSTGTLTIPVNATTLSNSERTFTVDILTDQTTAGAASYSVGSVVIPAGEYTGSITIDGTDVNVETTPETLALRIADGSGYVSGRTLVVSVFQVCPVPDTFATGTYLLEAVTTNTIFGSPILQPGMTFDVTSDGLTRSFMTQNFANFCTGSLAAFDINLVCNETVVPTQGTNCDCGGDNSFEPGGANGTYDPNDDSVLTFQFVRICGANTAENTYRLVKQ